MDLSGVEIRADSQDQGCLTVLESSHLVNWHIVAVAIVGRSPSYRPHVVPAMHPVQVVVYARSTSPYPPPTLRTNRCTLMNQPGFRAGFFIDPIATISYGDRRACEGGCVPGSRSSISV